MEADRVWACWLTATVGVFFALEAHALRNRHPEVPSGTLTATMRRWLGLHPLCRRRYLLGPLFAGFLGYLWLHFLHGRFNT